MRENVFIAIVLMTAVTYGSRALPMLLLTGKRVDGYIKEFIEAVPVALLAALVIPELVMPGGTLAFGRNPFLWAGVITFVFAKKVPNLFLGVSFGMLVYWLLTLVL